MKKIFISYRRTDAYDTNRLAKVLKKEFGGENVFFDTDSMRAGQDWPLSTQRNLIEADLMLLIVGPRWLHAQDEQSGRRRIDLPEDRIRKEITTFLERKKHNPELVMIPILVNGATMPERKYLDPALRPLCDFQSISVPNTGRSTDFAEIIAAILRNKFLPVNPPPIDTPPGYPFPEQLTQNEEDEFLAHFPGWRIVETEKSGLSGDYFRELYRVYEFETYDKAWQFICKVDSDAIRRINHHPRWQNTHRRVEVWLSTFNIGHKPSKKDVNLAMILEKLWKEFEPW